MIAVVVDHNNGTLYKSPYVAVASYFSVSLFVLLSGISAYISAEKKGCTYIRQWKRIGRLLIDYAVGTLILLLWYYRFFDWNTYVLHLKNFSIQGPFYFYVFFIQLVVICPLLIRWCVFCNQCKLKAVWQLLTVLALCWVSAICINYTYILPVHGGGQFLFGGTYLLLYYLGILFASRKVFSVSPKVRLIIFIVALPAWVVWWVMMTQGKLPFDSMVSAYWGGGFNPPSIQFGVFAIITLFLLYSFFSLLEMVSWKWIQGILETFAVGGRNTLYIFMYHLLVRDILFAIFPQIQGRVWVMRFTVFPAMIILPVLVVLFMKRVYRKCAGMIASASEGM